MSEPGRCGGNEDEHGGARCYRRHTRTGTPLSSLSRGWLCHARYASRTGGMVQASGRRPTWSRQRTSRAGEQKLWHVCARRLSACLLLPAGPLSGVTQALPTGRASSCSTTSPSTSGTASRRLMAGMGSPCPFEGGVEVIRVDDWCASNATLAAGVR